MAKLFLSSWFARVAGLFPRFAGDCCGKRVVFIPTAGLHEKFTPVKSDLKALRKLGLVVGELEISTASREEIARGLDAADFIYVEGGNTFFLLQELRRTGADKLIIQQVNGGKPYIGMSAGSVVAARDIEYLKFMDSPTAAPGLKGDYAGLGLVDFAVVPHLKNLIFNGAVKKIIAAYNDALDLRPVTDKQAIVVDGARVEQVEI